MIILRQKEFNSKAQKAMRRKWDLEQAMDAHSYLDEENLKIQKAKSQDSMLGRKKTNELIDKATKQTKTEPEKWLGATVGKKHVLRGKDKKEIEEMENATNLLRAGRNRSKDTHNLRTVPSKQDNSFKTELDRKITNNEAYGSFIGRNTLGANKDRNDWEFDNQLKKQIKERKKRMFKEESAKKVKDFVKDNKKGLAIGGAALGTAALVGGGIAIHRHNKKKKAAKEEENNDNTKK